MLATSLNPQSCYKMARGRVIVGLSGGVDSAVAALLLKKEGYEVIGVFMKNWEEEVDGVCTSMEDYESMRACADCIGIPYYTVNFAKEYKTRVFSYFLDEYSKGRTPNPDILCNSEIKFSAFLELSSTMGADYLATGHYAQLSAQGGMQRLLRGADSKKDQSYFLAGLKQEQLKNVLFPVGGLTKAEVRAIAQDASLPNANRKDSTGICFIGERHFKQFLMQYLPKSPGDIVDLSGRHVGRHDGLMYYTIGQRKGLGIGGTTGGTGESWFVIGKALKKNLLIVQQGEQDELYSTGLSSTCVNWLNPPKSQAFTCTAKFRYRQDDQQVDVKLKDEGAHVHFHKAQRAITCGQWVVFYSGEECLGGGPIDVAYPKQAFQLESLV